MDPLSKQDAIYNAGVESAPVWELKLNGVPAKKMYLEGVPEELLSAQTLAFQERHLP